MDMLSTRRRWLAGAAATVLASAAPVRLPRKIRIGLIGLDGHYGEITEHLSEVPDAEFVALSDAKPQNHWNVRVYPGYRQMLDQEKLDIAAVCNVNGEHAAAILDCAEHKVNVISEKPLATEMADLERVKKAVAESGIHLTTLLTMRWEAPYRALKAALDAGKIGEVALITAQKSYKAGTRPEWYRHRATYGGTMPWIGIHMVDLMRWIGAREFVEAFSYETRIGFPELRDMENVTATLFRLDNGGIADLHMDYFRPETAPTHGDDRLRVAGTRGVVEYQSSTGVTLLAEGEPPRVIQAPPAPQSLLSQFVSSVFLGSAPPLLRSDIYRTNEIVLLARTAAEEHRIVRL